MVHHQAISVLLARTFRTLMVLSHLIHKCPSVRQVKDVQMGLHSYFNILPKHQKNSL
jgi:hypothetical protein